VKEGVENMLQEEIQMEGNLWSYFCWWKAGPNPLSELYKCEEKNHGSKHKEWM